MNKILYFGLGLLTGAAGGGAATYFLTKDRIQASCEEDMECYADHCDERIEKYREEIADLKRQLGVIKDPVVRPAADPEEEKIARNEGVKKYHHDNGLSTKYGQNHIFEKVAEKPEEVKDSKLINDIDEDEFMNQENGYEKQTIDVFLGDDKYMCGVWGYGTDNEDDVDRKWGKPLEALIGESHTYEELLSYVEGSEDGIGLVFVRNDEMKIEFELVLHDTRDEDK